MNIFYTNECPIKAADTLAYRHIVKMILEGTQMLSTCHHILGSDLQLKYKPTHPNHPSNVWVRKSKAHYEWLWLHTKRMCEIYTETSGKIHKAEYVLDDLISSPSMAVDTYTPPPACVDNDLKGLPVTTAYRTYLNRKYNEWLGREKPLKVEFKVDTPDWFKIEFNQVKQTLGV